MSNGDGGKRGRHAALSAGMGLLAIIAAGTVAAGLGEARAHRRALDSVPLRIHVNGTRGKSSVTKAVTALLRALGKRVVGKTTGTLPVVIEPDGTERLIRRRGRTRVHEQVRILRYAAAARADVAVLECMAVNPELQWVCEHVLVRSHIGVITNVRRDHFEEMGRRLEEVARSLANTVPRNGVLVTADVRFVSIFEEVAATRNTTVVLVGPDEVRRAFRLLAGDSTTLRREREEARRAERVRGRGAGDVIAALEDEWLKMHAENVAVACKVVELAGFPEAAVWEAANVLARPRLRVTDLSDRFGRCRASGADQPGPGAGRRCQLVHVWSMNDTDSFGRLLAAAARPEKDGGSRAAAVVALYNHRSDRPLRALEFGRLFAAEPAVCGVLVTGDAGGRRLLRRAGVSPEKLRTLRPPLTMDAVAAAAADVAGASGAGSELPVIVFGCGNARGVESLELGGELL